MNKHFFHRPELRRPYRALLALSLAALAQFCGRDIRSEAAQPDAMHVGLARVCITPEKPLWLHGYAGKTRFRPFEGKLNDLYAKAMALEDARGERAVLITVDLCVLRAAEAKALFGHLTERTGLQRRQLLVNFSHTHSGPILGASDLDRYPMSAEARQATLDYTARLFEKIADVALAALADLKPATLAWGRGKCDFVRNRRLYHADGSYRGMGPNADKYVDDTVPVLRVCAPDGTLRGIVFGCACHPVTFGSENLKHSNEVDGYLPDATIVAEGGYEARGLVADIGFYSADAETVLVKAVAELAGGPGS